MGGKTASLAKKKLLPLTEGKAALVEQIRKATGAAKTRADALTPFQRNVLAACACVPHGSVATYGALAAHIGKPGAARGVGGALGKNPLAPAIPCHRVVGSNRHLTGFNGEAGVNPQKVALLAKEGVAVKDGRVAAEAMIF